MAIPAASSYSPSLQALSPEPVHGAADAPRPRAPSLRPLAPTGRLLQAAAALPTGYRRGAPPAPGDSDSEDSGKSDSDSASDSDADAGDDAADATTRADPQASASSQAALQSSSSEESGKSDSDSASCSDDEHDAADGALDGTPASTDSIELPRPGTAPSAARPGDALFTGVATIRSDDISVGAYLASGAFGKVHRGTWGAEAVALKEIDYAHAKEKLPLSEEDFLEAMQWEVSRMATASHPNLVQFHGLCRKDGKTYIVMEFCEGGSLVRALEKGGIPPSRLWQWMRQIADALAYLHGQGMLHRDLKAENILLDGRGRARLADLGVAQVDALLDETEAKAVNLGLQDVSFIAPENIANVQGGSLRQSSKATDIYALGTVFWQMLSGGAAPSSWSEVLNDPDTKAALTAGVRMPIPEDCPQPVRELILSCWRMKPAERADIAAVLRQLHEMGPQLHPQAAIVDMLEHLEASVHPKRQQVRDYVPTQVTAQRVEGSADAYWTQREQEVGAAPVLTVSTGGYTGVNSTMATTSLLSSTSTAAAASTKPNPPMPLQAALDDFVAQADAGTFLLLGEGGMGKSISMVLLAERLLRQWWQHLADPAGVPRPRHLPNFIRDHVDEWSDTAIADAWTKIAAQAGLSADATQPLVFFDAYDECRIDPEKAANLGKRLGLPADGKLIVTCRPYVVKEEDHVERFGWNGRLLIRHALPFTLDQMLDYLHARLDWNAATHARYLARLQQSADLRAVLRNPFMLYLLRQSWETVSRQPLEALTRAQLYAGFIAHMVDQGSKLLAPEVRATLQGDGPSFADSYAAFTESIALLAAFGEDASLPEHEADKAASPWSRLEDLLREEAWRRYEEREARLARLDESRQKEHKRRKVLSLEDFIAMRSEVAAQLHGMLPLRLRGGVYEFVHKSVFEYCAARKLLLEVRTKDGGMTEESLRSVLGWMNTSAPGILLFAEEFLQFAGPGQADLDADPEVVQRRMCMVFDAVGLAMEKMERYEKALAIRGKTAAIREKVLGTEHVDTATSCSDMGRLLADLGRHEEALASYRKAIAVFEKVLGTEHPYTATACNNLGLLLQAMGRHEEALAHHRKAMAVREKILGTEHRDTANSYDNTGSLLVALGRHEEALAYYRKAMAIYEKVSGTEHADTATSCSNMGALLECLGRHEEALAYHRKAMAIREKVFGPEHSDTANSYNNTGLLLADLGRHEEALAYYRTAIAVREKIFGTEHADTATSCNNMGTLLQTVGRHEEALAYFNKAISVREKLFGTEHADTAGSYSNMASVLQDLDRHEEALDFSRKAMAILERVLGTAHADTATCYNNVGLLLADLGRHEEALAYIHKAIAVFEKVFGTEHASTANSFNSMGSLLHAEARHEEALAYFGKAMAIREKILGGEHLDTANSCDSMGALLEDLGRHEEALTHYRKAMAIRERVLGAAHADTATAYSNMGWILQAMGRHEEALAYHRKALRIAEALGHPNEDLYRETVASLGETVDAPTTLQSVAQDPRHDASSRPSAERSTDSPHVLLPRAMQNDTGGGDEDAGGDPEADGSRAAGRKARRRPRRRCAVM